MKNFLPVLFFGIFVFNNLQAQLINTSAPSNETPNEYYLQVKQFDEFLNRFNYKSDWKGNLMDEGFAAKYPRARYLSFLFNQEDNRFKNPNDSSYRKQVQQFINEITEADSQMYISLYSGQVKSHALVHVNYKGKAQLCTITLMPEVLDDRSAKWVICEVKSTFFSGFADSLKTNFIAPNSHETSFINLKRLENLSNPIFFYPQNINSDPSLLFLTEVACGRITINHIEKLSYEISFPGWVITVEEFLRNNYNSGWLISDLKKIIY